MYSEKMYYVQYGIHCLLQWTIDAILHAVQFFGIHSIVQGVQPTDAFDIFGRWVSALSWRGVI